MVNSRDSTLVKIDSLFALLTPRQQTVSAQVTQRTTG